jgi:VanZ like family.
MIRKNILSISAGLIILYLSLASSETFNKIHVFHFRGMDKVVHFAMYAVFTGVILYENRKRIQTAGNLFFAAFMPFIFGAILELLQSLITTTRTGSIYDLLCNLLGIVFSVVIYLLVRNLKKERIR